MAEGRARHRGTSTRRNSATLTYPERGSDSRFIALFIAANYGCLLFLPRRSVSPPRSLPRTRARTYTRATRVIDGFLPYEISRRSVPIYCAAVPTALSRILRDKLAH